MIPKLLKILCLCIAISPGANFSYAAPESTVKIGILSLSNNSETVKNWAFLKDNFIANLPATRVQILPLSAGELERAIESHQLDYIITNPFQQVAFQYFYGVSTPLATLSHHYLNKELTAYGGTLFTLAKRADINNLEDIETKKVAITFTDGLGPRELLQYELSFKGHRLLKNEQYLSAGVPPANTVMAVLNQQADVGFVRAGVLEKLAKQGKIQLSDFKVINRQNFSDFPWSISTHLLPEWAISALPHVPQKDIKKVLAALYKISPETDSLNGTLDSLEFIPPVNYNSVTEILRLLKCSPFDSTPNVTMSDLWAKYRLLFSVSAILTLLLFITLIYLILTKKKIIVSQKRYLTLLNSQNDAIFLHQLKPEGFACFSEVNDVAVERYGYSRKEFSQLNAAHITRPDEAKKHGVAAARKNLLNLKRTVFETIHIKKSGEELPVEVNATVTEIDGKKYILSTARDITDRKQAETKNKAYQQQLKTILNSIDANVYVADIKTNEILFMNENMIQDLGQDMTGKTCWEEFRGDSAHSNDCTDHLLVDESGQPTGVHVWDSQNPVNGKYYINHDRAIEWADGRLVRLQIATDISDIRSMEQQLRLKHKMEAVGYMAGGMAHNFNNNLSIILGNVELSQMKLPKDNDIFPLLENAKTAIRNSRDLVLKIITYSRQGIQNKSYIRIADVIDEITIMLKSTLPATVNLKQLVSPESRNSVINADPSQIHEVLINLCNNAVQAMKEKGELTIILDSVDLKDKDISAQYEASPGSYVKLSVLDTGCGMATEILDKIFDPFFTTKEEYEGAGMGLATVQGIVAQHGGVIKVYSSPEQGTVFDLYFPSID
jgi:PAS domain S-box-containing protein